MHPPPLLSPTPLYNAAGREAAAAGGVEGSRRARAARAQRQGGAEAGHPAEEFCPRPAVMAPGIVLYSVFSPQIQIFLLNASLFMIFFITSRKRLAQVFFFPPRALVNWHSGLLSILSFAKWWVLGDFTCSNFIEPLPLNKGHRARIM